MTFRQDKSNTLLLKRAESRRTKIMDRRRHIHTTPADGRVVRLADKGAVGTMHPAKVFSPSLETDVLTDGAFNSKIGGDVLVGRLKGARIKTLTLEERRTCPRACIHWTTCYGNSLGRAKRWEHGAALEVALKNQVRRHFEQKTPSKWLVRLHVLGDFYSMVYLQVWVDLLDQYPDLSVFGFTAWGAGTEIGEAVKRVRAAIPDQFAIRTSGETGAMGSWTIDWPTEKRFVRINGDSGMVCPEQMDANNTGKRLKHCGNCAACWQANVAVVFVEH